MINSIKIGKIVQPVQYEGIHMLCFACGRIGHRKECCPSLVRGPTSVVDNQVNGSPKTNLSPKEACTIGTGQGDGKDDVDDMYGNWMVMKRKTRPYGNGKGSCKGFGREGVEIKDDCDDRMDTRYTP